MCFSSRGTRRSPPPPPAGPEPRLEYQPWPQALALFAAAWLARRCPAGARRRRLLGRIDLLHEPIGRGPCSLRAVRGRVERRWPAAAAEEYSLLLVDEALLSPPLGRISGNLGPRSRSLGFTRTRQRGHPRSHEAARGQAHHLYDNAASRAAIERLVGPRTRRLLLSDVSQAGGATHLDPSRAVSRNLGQSRTPLSGVSQAVARSIAYPAGAADVHLSEVVRCSRRIVAGAMAFQLGGEAKLLTRCHHESTGPPLRSFLFDAEREEDGGGGGGGGGGGSSSRFERYARHCMRALEHATCLFPRLALHNRVALVVPDATFREGLAASLAPLLAPRGLGLATAAQAAAELGEEEGAGGEEEGEGGEEEEGEEEEAEAEAEAEAGSACPLGEWLVLDEVSAMDGLERLVVVAVGLDTPVRPAAAAGSGGARAGGAGDGGDRAVLETRSTLYRALTRAQCLAMVVNEHVPGGWLEFLAHVSLRQDEQFEPEAAMQRTEAQPAEPRPARRRPERAREYSRRRRLSRRWSTRRSATRSPPPRARPPRARPARRRLAGWRAGSPPQSRAAPSARRPSGLRGPSGQAARGRRGDPR